MVQSSKRRAPRVLVIAPHPDDEVLATGGVIQEHLRKGHVIKVLLVTCGDGQRRGLLLPPKHFLRLGERRYRESLTALQILGVHEKQVVALGYPDRGLAHLRAESSQPYPSPYTKARAVPYEWAYRPGAPYTYEALLADLKEILMKEHPHVIYLPHPQDRHGDHQAVYFFTRTAVHELRLHPHLRHYLIHYGAWPLPAGKCFHRPLLPPRSLQDNAQWLAHELSEKQIARKCQAVQCYRSQMHYIEDHLFSYVRRNELFDLQPSLTQTRLVRLPKLLIGLRRGQSSALSHE